jgi:1-acyl-sn-glycerol-3-phosphate acyltransferase
MSDIPHLPDPPYADYDSPEIKVGALSRAFPSLAFYARVTHTVFKAARTSKRGKFDDAAWYHDSLLIRDAFEKTGATISIKGTEHVAKLEEPCIFIGNHMSTAETFLLATMILPYRPITFVIKQALMDYPVFKHIMRTRKPIVVGRVNPREDLKAVMGGGQEQLKAGKSIIIFPQKTRADTFSREGFNTIGVKLAKRAGVPIIPLALKTNAWSNGKKFKDFGPFLPHEDVRFEFGAPIRIDGSDREAHETVIEFIETRMKKWGVGLD